MCAGTCVRAGDVSALGADVRVMCHFTIPEYRTYPGQELILVSAAAKSCKLLCARVGARYASACTCF